MELSNRNIGRPDEGLLIRELTHRIKNELTCAVSMISLAAARATNQEVKITLTEVMERLHDYARVHQALHMPPGDGSRIDAVNYLRRLCQSISSSKLDRQNISLVFVECPLTLDAQQCWLLGMILYELIINAARHAFDGSGGEIRVQITERGSHVDCQVSDDGTGTSQARAEGGLRIVRELAACLGGRFEWQCGLNGSISAVVFPARG
jgi:two-component sensor histidine kinase